MTRSNPARFWSVRVYVSGAAGGAVAAVLSAAHAGATGRPRLAASCVLGAPRFAHASGMLALFGMSPYPGPVVVLSRAVDRATGGCR